MADEEKQQAEQNKQNKEQNPEAKSDGDKGQLLQWIIMATLIILLAVVGYFLGATLGYKPAAAQAGSKPKTETADESQADLVTENAKGQNKGWFYDLDPVATNLSDPGSTRYIRAVLTLEMSPEADKEKGTQFLDERKPVIANILNIYFAGLTVDQLNSDKDMRRIQYELLEIFNDTLYKDSKPLIRQILFREFGVQ